MKAKVLFLGLAVGLALLLARANDVAADTPVSGNIATDTTWTIANSPYVVTDNILVAEGVNLTIDSGVVVKFDADRALQINGTLLARGNATEKIKFTTNESGSCWGYILFTDSSTDAIYDINGNYTGGSILEYCIVEQSHGADVSNNGAVRIDAAHPFISYCTFENNQVSPIHAWNLSEDFKVMNSSIRNNGGTGIYASRGIITISGNTIQNNRSRDGGICINYADANIIKNIIMGNSSRGISITSTASITTDISSNIIINNSGGGIFTFGGIGAIYNNLIGNNYSSAGGGGILNRQPSGFDIHNNIIFENHAGGSAGAIGINDWGVIKIFNNSIVRNEADNASAISYDGNQSQLIQYNTIIGNRAKSNSTNSTIFLDGLPILIGNNIFGNVSDYELFNNNLESSDDLIVEYNWWGVSDGNDISVKIYDWYDDSAKGLVDFDPWETNIRTDSPISPPGNIKATNGNGSITLTWDPNKETDVAGYKVHWRMNTGLFANVIDHPYTNVADVGDINTYTLSGLAEGKYDFTITAYDSNYNPANDNSLTLVNENQTNGNESWFAAEQIVKIGPRIQADPADHDFGNINTLASSSPETFTITNVGNKELIIGTISITGSDALNFIIQFDSVSGQSLNPGGNAAIGVVFSPTSDGIKKAYLSIPSNDEEYSILKIPLIGIGGPQTVFGTLEWKYEGNFETPAIGSNGTIYAGSSETYSGSMDRKFYAFNPDGTAKWIFRLEAGTFGPIGEAKAAIGGDGTIYVASTYGSKFYAINPDGTLKWFFQPEAWKNGVGSTWGQPAIGSDGTIYFGSRESGPSEDFGSTNWGDGKLYALNPDGSVKWAAEVESGLTAPAIASDGTIYIGTAGGSKIRAISPEGTEKWVFEAPGIFWVGSSPAIGPEGTIYIGRFDSEGKYLYAINPKGTKKWKFETGDTIRSSPAVGPEGTIYVGSGDNKFYAINPDGTEKWSFETGASVDSSPAIGANGTIYFGSKDNKFYALNPNGTLKWPYQSDAPIDSSPAIGFDGVIYVGSSKDLLAIVCGSKGLAGSSWPMLGHDLRHSGNSMNGEQVYPIADAGEDQRVDETALVTLNASASTDPDGSIVRYHWLQLSGPEVTLSNDTDIQPIFTAPNVGMNGDVLVFRLTVTDDGDLQSADTVEVIVEDTLVSTASHEFGSTGVTHSSAPLVITISNLQTEDLDVYDITLSDPENFTLDLNGGTDPLGSLPRSIAPGGSAIILVIFNPASPGIFHEKLIISSNDPGEPQAEILLHGWGKNVSSQEDFIVTLGQNKVFTAFNVYNTSGDAMSDGQNARACVEAGPYESGTSEAWAGVEFQIEQGTDGTTWADALISVTFSYQLDVDFDVLPPSEQGGGSADARMYAWIENYKKEIDYISFVHDAGFDEKAATVTFTHRLADAPTWTHLYAGQTYEVTADLYTQAQVYAGHEATSCAEVTVREVRVYFDMLAGDLNFDGNVDLTDAILGLQVIGGLNPQGIGMQADVNGDNKIGTEEIVYILQELAGLR